MPLTPDRYPGTREEDELLLEEQSASPSTAGTLRYVNGAFSQRDSIGLFDPRPPHKVKVSSDDTTPDFLEPKLQSSSGTVLVSTVSPGGAEKINLEVGIADTFRAVQIETAALISTSSVSNSNAFAGEPSEYLTVIADGDYLVTFEGDTMLTNSNGVGEISIGVNDLVSEAGSERQLAGNQRRSSITIKKVAGLVVGDTVFALYRMVSGSGSMEIRGRSLSMFRIAE